MIRAIPAVAAGLLCGMAGVRHAALLRGNARRQRRWAELLPMLALLLGEGTLSIPQALTLAATEQAEPDNLLRSAADMLMTHPTAPLCDIFRNLLPPWPESDVLLRMASSLGRGSQASRCHAVQQAAAQAQQLAESAHAVAEKDARLWQTLGWTCGACLALLLI